MSGLYSIHCFTVRNNVLTVWRDVLFIVPCLALPLTRANVHAYSDTHTHSLTHTHTHTNSG